MNTSPFQPTRFEQEGRHLYFLPRTVFESLEPPKSAYLIGSRGTGKTTLLKALSWNERLNNESLRRQLPSDVFASRYVGVYLKLPEYVLEAFDERLAGEKGPIRSLIPALYLDAITIQLLADALAELITANLIPVSPSQEHECISDILALLPTPADSDGQRLRKPQPRTLKGLGKEMQRLQMELAQFAVRGCELGLSTLSYLSGQIGKLGRDVSERLGHLCNGNTRGVGNGWHFKICMDEGECLSPDHQRVLNTIVRLSRWPLFHFTSFVRRPEDISGTFVPNLTLSDADRKLVLLDQMEDKEFRCLAEGVATVRVQEQLNDFSVNFASDTALGGLSINRLALAALNESTQKYAKDLLKSAREMASHPAFSTTEKNETATSEDQEDTGDALPIYQTYLIQKLNLKMDANEPRWKKRADESANLRKKMVAAYLSLCAAIRADIRFASSAMVLQMSDKCIREFLNFLHEIFVESRLDLREFLQREVPLKIQDAAIKRASQQKWNSLKESGVVAPTEAGRIIDALAKITRRLQTEGPAHLRASERGLFVLEFSDAEKRSCMNALELIRDAAEAGFLILLQDAPSSMEFRVHASLAAAYGFSYRGAYYKTPLQIREIDEIRKLADPKQFEEVVRKIGRRLAGWEEETGNLFDSTNNGNSV